MKRKMMLQSWRIVQLEEAYLKPIATFPSQTVAAKTLGVTKQAINKAITTGQRVKGFLWMKLVDYERLHV